MTKRSVSRGKCSYCGEEVAKTAATRHIAKCSERLKVIEQAEQKDVPSETLYYLRVQDADVKEFWLDLEMRSSSKMNALDKYLRDIWLECCHHLSEFQRGGWGGEIVGKQRNASSVFFSGQDITHIYDFGTSSETLIKVMGERKGKPTTKHPIALMIRNLMPEVECLICQKPATWFCRECMYEDQNEGTLCEEHVKDHPHHNYGEPIFIVNSPRLGMCGYDGPAEPPY